jgi:hypothetical protein
MNLRKREFWLGDDVCHVLGPVHVHDLLVFICEYWSTYWGVEHLPIPTPIPYPGYEDAREMSEDEMLALEGKRRRHVSSAEVAELTELRASWRRYTKRVHKENIQRRHRALQNVQRRDQRLFVDAFVEENAESAWTEAQQELAYPRPLWTTVIRKALQDFSTGVCSPRAVDQRYALNAYWWLMGLGWVNPAMLSLKPLQQEGDLLQSALLKSKKDPRPLKYLPDDENVFDHIDLAPKRLVDHLSVHPPLFNGASPEILESLSLTSFATVCEALGYNPRELRSRVYLSDPIAPASS